MQIKYNVEFNKRYIVTVNGKKTRYSDYEELTCGYAKVKKRGKWGLLDYKGRLVVNILYDDIKKSGMGSFKLTIKDKQWLYLTTVGCLLPVTTA